jgi:hypothetical protein
MSNMAAPRGQGLLWLEWSESRCPGEDGCIILKKNVKKIISERSHVVFILSQEMWIIKIRVGPLGSFP